MSDILNIQLPVNSKVKDLKEILFNMTDLQLNEQKIICKGKILSDDTIISNNMKNMVLYRNKETIDINETKPCISGCGFYGTFLNNWYCSKCYVNSKQIETTDITEPNITEVDIDERIEVDILQENSEICWKCDKKVGLLGFKCKCKYVFCGKHRHGVDHDCIFDWKEWDRKRLNKQYNSK